MPGVKRRKSSSSSSYYESSSEKPKFFCAICSRSYCSKYSINLHNASVHLKVKKYACPLCDYKAAQWVNMQRHLKSKHLITFKSTTVTTAEKQMFLHRTVPKREETIKEEEVSTATTSDPVLSNGDDEYVVVTSHDLDPDEFPCITTTSDLDHFVVIGEQFKYLECGGSDVLPEVEPEHNGQLPDLGLDLGDIFWSGHDVTQL